MNDARQQPIENLSSAGPPSRVGSAAAARRGTPPAHSSHGAPAEPRRERSECRVDPRTVAGALLLALLWVAVPSVAQHRGECGGQRPTTWSIRIAPEGEPGTPMVVEGRVLEADGETPVAGATVFVFHTDAAGYYSPGGMDESDARLCGLMLSGEDGRYRFESVRPAHYATGGPPAHVHYRVWGPAISPQNFALNFEGDPKLGARGRDASANPTWATIRPVEVGADGVVRVTRDLRLR